MTTKRGPGRPKGSKTQTLPTVQVVTIPRGCPHCGHSEREVLSVVRTRQFDSGQWIRGDGGEQLLAKRIKWRRCKCRKCEGVYNERLVEVDDAQ